MNLATLMTDLAACNAEVKVNNVVTQTSLGLSSIQMGFLNDLNVQDEIFPLCLVIPPSGGRLKDKTHKDKLDVYIIFLDRSTTGERYTPAERPAVYELIKNTGYALIDRLFALTTQTGPKYQRISDESHERNLDEIISQPCIWMQFTLTVKTADCV